MEIPPRTWSTFCFPITALCKTDYRVTDAGKTEFTQAYRQKISDVHRKDTWETLCHSMRLEFIGSILDPVRAS